MADGFSLLVVLIEGAVLGVGTLILVSTWRSVRHRKMFYMLLLFNELAWLLIFVVPAASPLERLFALVGVSRAWQVGVEGVLFALPVATLVLLYRHRHDPDPDDL